MAERELLYNPAPMAVADAMMLAQVRLLDNSGDFFSGEELDPIERILDREQKTTERTWKECLTGVKFSLDYLARKHSEKFDALVALVAQTEVDPIILGWGKHYYFLAKDTSGIWYAGSPANHLPFDKESRLTTPLISANIADVIDGIQQKEKGRWPDPSFIEQVASHGQLGAPRIQWNPETNQSHLYVSAVTNLGGTNNWQYDLPLFAA